LPKIGETLWYAASWREHCVVLLSFSAAALKCAARDRWIGWSWRQPYARLKLVVNHSRFLILPDGHWFNWGSRVLSLCQRRLPKDWEEAFGHGVVLLETFVDPQRHRGTVYRAAHWMYVGNTRGFRRIRGGYTSTPESPRWFFSKRCGRMPVGCLPSFFSQIPDPRRAQGTRHRMSTVLGIAAGAVFCGMRGYRAMADWAQSLGQKSRERLGCRREQGQYVVPSESILRAVLIRVTPADLDRERYGSGDESLAIDGKTMCNALDAQGQQTHVMSVVGHPSQDLLHPKKVGTLPVAGPDQEEVQRTNEIKTAIPLLEVITIEGQDVTADALLTQREWATSLVERRKAHYYLNPA
jgi:hypothetical protein